MNTFKSIVVATDFSKNAKYAYQYAVQLAQSIGAKVKLVHIYGIPVDLNREGFPAFTPDFEALEKKMFSNLKNFAHNEDVECAVYQGFAGDILIDLSKKEGCDMLVVGSKGETGLVEKLFGGIAALVMHKAFCPVLVVPPKSKFTGIDNIIYTLSKESAEPNFIRMASRISIKANAKLHLVHINNAGASKMPDLRQIVQTLDVPCEVVDLDFVSTRGGIDVYREKNKAGLVIAATHHYAFWENLTHASVTDSLIWNSEVPILVLHREDKN
jgi:nucleotide-binding universal stress UspA family protein